MKTWLPLFAAGLLLAGCRTDPRLSTLFESMNAEKRDLEDRIYELEDEADALVDQVESARRENAKLRKLAGGEDSGDADSSRLKRGAIFPRAKGAGKSNGSSPGEADPEAPMIDLGTPDAPNEAVPPKKSPTRPGIPGAGDAPAELPNPAFEVEPAAYVEPEDPRVTHIVLNPFLTGGHDFDHKPGDDGVAVIIEPRNADDEFVGQGGPVSIVVIDTEAEAEKSRVARWDFDSLEAGKRLKKNGIGRGIQLKLPWPNQPPEHAKLRIFVRYETLDGRQLEVFRDVTIAKPGQYSQRWTPRPLDAAALRSARPVSSVLVGHSDDSAEDRSLISKKKPASAETARRPSWQPNR